MEPFPLAAELVELVVSHIDDSRDLRSCRLLSQAFCRAASQNIFRSISVTLYDPPVYTNKRCEVMNEMLQSKPYILNWIRSLNVKFSMGRGPQTLQWDEEDQDYDLVEPHSIHDHQEFTKFLLTMTCASGLEELVVKWCSQYRTLRHVGQDIVPALIAVRFMPSLRRLQLVDLEDPPMGLVIGHPDVDGITNLSVKRGSFDVGKSEAYWKDLEIPTQGPLSSTFREARVDWDSVSRVQSQLSTFNVKEMPFFHTATHLDLNPILPIYDYLKEVQLRLGGRQSAFEQLKVLRYWSFTPSPTWNWDDPDPRVLEKARQMVGSECSTIQKLILDIEVDEFFYRGLSQHCVLFAS